VKTLMRVTTSLSLEIVTIRYLLPRLVLGLFSRIACA
jgi:hypothetical protein